MYGSTAIITGTVAGTGLAFTGVGTARYIVVATLMIITGMLLLRLGHRRAAHR